MVAGPTIIMRILISMRQQLGNFVKNRNGGSNAPFCMGGGRVLMRCQNKKEDKNE
tara:strand:- start:919 stop:1083 length:165 start_codon:yes stop_codon:yes gene_type:complete